MPRKKTATQLVSDAERGFKILERELRSAQETREKLKRQLSAAKGNLTKKRSGKAGDALYAEIVREMLADDIMPLILMSEMDKATEVNDEFSRSIYKGALNAAAQDIRIYKLIKVGEGWNSDMRVLIDLEESAGDLQDWARGIIGYREVLNVKTKAGNSKQGFRATNWWLQNVWGTGLEVKTIAGRLQYSGQLAPFWGLLNFGSTSLESDRRDGAFNPIPARPTDFLGEAQQRIRLIFQSTFYPEKAKWLEEARLAEQKVDEAEDRYRSYDYEVRNLSDEVELNQRVYNSFGEKKRFVDEDRLTEALRRLRVGDEFERPQIELTKSGSGARVRTSVSSLKRRVEGLDY